MSDAESRGGTTDSSESQPGAADTHSPRIVVMRRGSEEYTLEYHPGETLLDTARRGGVPLLFNCERGECGTCIVTILSGAVKMRANEVLSEDDIRSGLALGCQSVPVTETIEIELP